MSDRAVEVAREFVPEHATRIMVDTAGGDRRSYSADEWHEQIAAALRAYAEEARREEREACAEIVDVASDRYRQQQKPLVAGGYQAFDHIAAAIRARGETR